MPVRLLPLLRPACLAACLAAAAATAAAEPASRSPYAHAVERDIAALSDAEIEGLLAGRGMGYAMAAELNGWPGPLHVLELAGPLQLDAGQRKATQALFDRMQAEAQALGAALVDAERALDRAFSGGDLDPGSLGPMLERIGRLQGQLRGVHLAAHIEQKALLRPDQVAGYARLRGYGEGGAHEGGHHQHGGH